ncbi:hypothetical protein SDC9_118572 [bioreactor metagenome]|uniref:Uncharacterized protein n=1 Tax=bioreactor metagenome TaxID=1076179 RepID=A0A645C903_9ZZZZ
MIVLGVELFFLSATFQENFLLLAEELQMEMEQNILIAQKDFYTVSVKISIYYT